MFKYSLDSPKNLVFEKVYYILRNIAHKLQKTIKTNFSLGGSSRRSPARRHPKIGTFSVIGTLKLLNLNLTWREASEISCDWCRKSLEDRWAALLAVAGVRLLLYALQVNIRDKIWQPIRKVEEYWPFYPTMYWNNFIQWSWKFWWFCSVI